MLTNMFGVGDGVGGTGVAVGGGCVTGMGVEVGGDRVGADVGGGEGEGVAVGEATICSTTAWTVAAASGSPAQPTRKIVRLMKAIKMACRSRQPPFMMFCTLNDPKYRGRSST